MNKQEIIEKLKDKSKAQPLALLTDEERAIFNKAGPDNMLWLSNSGSIRGAWATAGQGENLGNTYILKPDYQPEPEYNDIPLVISGSWVQLMEDITGCETLPIAAITDHKDFAGFFYTMPHGGNVTTYMSGEATQWVHLGREVKARFRA